jgi:hypothetical protein
VLVPIVFLLFEFPIRVAEVFAHAQAIASDLILKVFALAALVFQKLFIVEDGVLGAWRGDILTLKRLAQKLFCGDLNFGGSIYGRLEHAFNGRCKRGSWVCTLFLTRGGPLSDMLWRQKLGDDEATGGVSRLVRWY